MHHKICGTYSIVFLSIRKCTLFDMKSVPQFPIRPYINHGIENIEKIWEKIELWSRR